MPLQEQRHFISVLQGLERCNELDVGDLKLMSVKVTHNNEVEQPIAVGLDDGD